MPRCVMLGNYGPKTVTVGQVRHKTVKIRNRLRKSLRVWVGNDFDPPLEEICPLNVFSKVILYKFK